MKTAFKGRAYIMQLSILIKKIKERRTEATHKKLFDSYGIQESFDLT